MFTSGLDRNVQVKNLNRCVIWTIERRFFPLVKSEINCASDGLVETQKPVCLVLLLLTNQLAGFLAPIPFRFGFFCHAFPVNKYPRNSPAYGHNNLACWIINLLWDVLLCSIAEYFYWLFLFWLALRACQNTAQLVQILSDCTHQNVSIIRYIYIHEHYLRILTLLLSVKNSPAYSRMFKS